MIDTEKTARRLGVNEQALIVWLEQIKLRTPRHIESGKSILAAVDAADDEFRRFLADMVVGETWQSKIAHKWITTRVYHECRAS